MSAAPGTDSTAWTIGRLLSWTSDYLARLEVEDSRLATEVLLAHAVGFRRIDLYTRFDEQLDEASLGRFREWVRRAAEHEPIAYLVEEKEFFSLPFRVTRDVLIPRPETEVLVECALDHCAGEGLTYPRILDLGTGSGCIAVTLLAQLAGACAVATDVSRAVLEVARCNAERHGMLDRLTLVEADRLALPTEVVSDGGFDLVVSNPPYVAGDAVADLDRTVRDFEPSVALSDGTDGLSFYRSLASDAASVLALDGVVIVEVGDGQARAATELLEQGGGVVCLRTLRDRVVGHERVLMLSPLRDT